MKEVFSQEELSQIFRQNVSSGVCDICLNSKEAKTGDLFIALKGEHTDGHDFIKEAIERGASLALTQKKIEDISEDKLIYVPSAYEALLELAKYNLRLSSETKYIAVTGSVGKTTTKNMIFHILSETSKAHSVYASKKNYNSQIGLPVCVALMPRNTKFAVFEMGMSAIGDIRKLTNIVNPSAAIITNISESHLEFFESPFDIAKAKSEILEKMPEIAIIPNDSPYADFLKSKAVDCGVKRIISFGTGEKSNARLLSYEFRSDYILVSANIFSCEITYKVRAGNIFFAYNSVAAIAAAYTVSDVDLKSLSAAISTFQIPPQRGEIIEGGITIIDDSYNASPASMKSAIRSLGMRESNGRKIAVLGDMLELGENSVLFHENLSAAIDKYGIDIVFACGGLSKRIFNNLRESKKGGWRENSQELAKILLKEIKDGDCILVKGSHSMNMGHIVDALKNLS